MPANPDDPAAVHGDGGRAGTRGHERRSESGGDAGSETVASLGERALLERLIAILPPPPEGVLGPGDDAAILPVPGGRVVITNDLMVEGPDFLRAWSSAREVGRKAVTSNLADIAAMGARPTALVAGLVLPPQTPAAWACELARGIADGLAGLAPECHVIGGDLSSGERIVLSVTAFGELAGRAVTRGGASAGDVLALAGRAGCSAAGLAALAAHAAGTGPGPAAAAPAGAGAVGSDSGAAGSGASGARFAGLESAGAGAAGFEHAAAGVTAAEPGGGEPDEPGPAASGADGDIPGMLRAQGAALAACIDQHLAPDAPIAAGAAAAEAGATAMMDVSDGLLMDAGRLARASGVIADIDPRLLAPDAAAIEPALAQAFPDLSAHEVRERAMTCVLRGGEDHALLAAFPAGTQLPAPFRRIGSVLPAAGQPGALVAGRPRDEGGWDPYAPATELS